MEGVFGAYGQVDAAIDERGQVGGVLAQDFRDIVGLPGSGDIGIDHTCIAVKQWHGSAVLAAGAPDPFEGRHLASVFAQNTFLLDGLLKGHRVFAVFADEWLRSPVVLAVKVLWRCGAEVWGEAAEV